MKRIVDRVLQVLVWGVALTLLWGVVGLTDWGSARSLLGAGPGYTHPLQPVGYLLGALLVAVPGTLLVRHAWAAWRMWRSEPGQNLPQQRSSPRPAPIPRGRTFADLPDTPPLARR